MKFGENMKTFYNLKKKKSMCIFTLDVTYDTDFSVFGCPAVLEVYIYSYLGAKKSLLKHVSF